MKTLPKLGGQKLTLVFFLFFFFFFLGGVFYFGDYGICYLCLHAIRVSGIIRGHEIEGLIFGNVHGVLSLLCSVCCM